jgi:cobalt-precorrin 5A hydrolase
MGRGEAMIVAGLGFRHGVTPDEIVAVVARALEEASLASGELHALATVTTRADEPGFREAAQRMRLRLLTADPQDMQAAASAIATHSPRVMALHGVGSVAEAAALSCAGENARLLLNRVVSGRVTCALARGEESRGHGS